MEALAGQHRAGTGGQMLNLEAQAAEAQATAWA